MGKYHKMSKSNFQLIHSRGETLEYRSLTSLLSMDWLCITERFSRLQSLHFYESRSERISNDPVKRSV